AQRSRRLRRPFSVLLADVDHFKQYNDTHGHIAGDAALTKIADILRKTTRAVDCVARYGGEEFLVVLLETTVTTAALVAERIRARVAGETVGEGRMSLSIGVAECPAHGGTPETLIASADAAMYQAKSGGRGPVVKGRAESFPAVVVLPQAPRDSVWSGAPARAAMQALEAVLREFRGDSARVYLTGLSMGGYGTWELALEHPGRFAALVPICGGIRSPSALASIRVAGVPADAADPYAYVAARLADTPVWLFHG